MISCFYTGVFHRCGNVHVHDFCKKERPGQPKMVVMIDQWDEDLIESLHPPFKKFNLIRGSYHCEGNAKYRVWKTFYGKNMNTLDRRLITTF